MSFSTKCWKGNKEIFFQCSHENTWQVDQEARHLQHVFCYTSHLCTSVHPCQDQKQAQEYIARSAAFNILSFNQTGCGSDRPHSLFYLMCSPGGGSRLIHTKIVWIWPSSFIFHKITQKNSSLPQQCDSSDQTTSSHLNPTYKLPFSSSTPAADIYKTCSNLQKNQVDSFPCCWFFSGL